MRAPRMPRRRAGRSGLPLTGGLGLLLFFVFVPLATAAGLTSRSSSAARSVLPAPPGAPVATAMPTISGQLLLGSTVSADRGTWTGLRPLTFNYKWRRCPAVGGPCDWLADTSGPDLRLGPQTVGRALRVVVVAHDAAGKSFALSAATGAVQGGSSPRNLLPPTISGTAQQGKTLHGSAGTWAGARPLRGHGDVRRRQNRRRRVRT